MALVFSNPDVAAKYDSDFDKDPVVHVPGGNGAGWKGKLSTIPLEYADKAAAQGSNVVKLKAAAPLPAKAEKATAK